MRKRIRLNQLRVGMYIDELESNGAHPETVGRVSSHEDIEHLMGRQVISVVIDMRKSADTVGLAHDFSPVEIEIFNASLRENYSDEQIAIARNTISKARPCAKRMFSKARQEGRLDLRDADGVVDQVMAETMSNIGAMIAVAKLKSKDEGTFLHSLSVSTLMITFGRHLGLDERTIRNLALGGMVHDLGKSALPVNLLNKTGRLTERELAAIQTHPQHGYTMLKSIEGMPKAVLDICLYHHEKYDGSGYTRRVEGKLIPLVARIAAICDVYDALTSQRPYKRAWSQAEALEKMLNSPGHFDRDLLETFISTMVKSGCINERLARNIDCGRDGIGSGYRSHSGV